MSARSRGCSLVAAAGAGVALVGCLDESQSAEPRPTASERVLLTQLDRGLRCARRETGRIPEQLGPALPYMSEESLGLLRTRTWETQIDPTGSGRGYALRLWSTEREAPIITVRRANGEWSDPDNVLPEPALMVCERGMPRDHAKLAALNLEAT